MSATCADIYDLPARNSEACKYNGPLKCTGPGPFLSGYG